MKRRYRLIVILMFMAAAVFAPGGIVFAQTGAPPAVNPWDIGEITATIFYGALGLVLFIASFFIFDRLLKLDLQRELVEDQNESIGIMLAGMFIGIAIIIAAAIT